MHILKNSALALIAAAGLGAAPLSQAQSLDDIALMQSFLELMTDYYGIIEATHEVSADPEKAAIMQMQKIQEVYEDRGDKAQSVDVLKKVLEDSNSRTIRNAAYLMLGDTLKDAGRASEALEYLKRGLEENIEAAE